jgi:hypothetical protein
MRRLVAAAVLLFVAFAFVVLGRFCTLERGDKLRSSMVGMEMLRDDLDKYRRDCGTYPPNLDSLVYLPKTGCKHPPAEPYLNHVPHDGWDNEFVYIRSDDGKAYRLISLGTDSIQSTETREPFRTQDSK